MAKRVAIQMDALASIDASKDSTFLMALEAQARGYEVWHYTPDKLSWHNGKIIAQATRITLREKPQPSYVPGKQAPLDLRKMDVVLMRQNPPLDMSYITATYLLEMLAPDVLVINDPAGVRNYPEKILPTLFPQFMPPTLITSNVAEAKAFRKEQKDIVLKPLYGFSGYDVMHIKNDGMIAAAFKKNPGPWIAQRFLPEMKDGERRLLFVDGKLCGQLARIPGKGQSHAGFQGGAQYIRTTLTARQKKMAAALGPLLKKHGLLFAGADIIGDYLTEINVTSPGSLWGMRRVLGISLEKTIWDAIEKRL